MSKATILTVDDDPMVLRAITRDLRARYGSDYRIVKASSGAQALAVLAELALRLRPVALIATDQRMPGMTGTEMLRQARQHAPDAKLLLLTAYADTDVAIKAINDIGLDYYLLKPWDPPAERLYPVIDDLLGDWQRAHPQETGDVRVVDHRWSERGHEIKTFLTRNYVPYRWVDVDQDDGPSAAGTGRGAATTICRSCSCRTARSSARRPPATSPERSACARAPSSRSTTSASSAAARRGWPPPSTRPRRACAPWSWSARRPVGRPARARRSRTTWAFPGACPGPTSPTGPSHRCPASVPRCFSPSRWCRSRSAGRSGRSASGPRASSRRARCSWPPGSPTGASRRRDSRSSPAAGSTTAPPPSDAAQCADDDVVVVGAANSAGQAALNFARYARRVLLLVRGGSLEDSMSLYLVARVQATANIDVRLHSEVAGARGDGHLESVTAHRPDSGDAEEVAVNWMFVFIGASPRTDWLGGDVVRDAKGFVVTGQDLLASSPTAWSEGRPPFTLETSVPGVFAAGDVRLDSMKRVASAVGEGAMSVYLVHRYLAMM